MQKPGAQDLKLAMRDLSKNVAQSVSELVKSCEALKGKILCGYLIYKFMLSRECKISQICVYDSYKEIVRNHTNGDCLIYGDLSSFSLPCFEMLQITV